MTKECDDKLTNSSNKLSDIQTLLEKYSIAFLTVGNSKMYDKLQYLANEVSIVSEDIKKTRSKIIDHDYKESLERSATILKTALDVNKFNKE